MPAFRPSGSHHICDALRPLPAGSGAADVTTRLLDLFTSGAVDPGTRLPPERRLSEVLAVSRSAVRESIATLSMLGVVEVRPSSGTYLRTTTSEVLPKRITWAVLIGERRLDELVDLRSALEIHAARLSAERCAAEIAARLDVHLAHMAANVDHLEAFLEADQAFHGELAAASGSSVLAELLSVTHTLLRAAARAEPGAAAHARVALAEHHAIRDAIATGDGEAAASAMAHHMRTARALFVERAA